ncbi:hypothetical protein GUITHDRAFT_101877 [Guillardia theta CCMP2712]|uniref:Uncharacterized protein n=1 Tax=Guillardia theta (strain CCMP2712) TaxID=905079 RepID=L1JVW8_GUITC|nr:hypothetical protein GUITHDRAFT_101877 [Guillardia theta CCMP2712]EKX52726.1 hypothetical protein GUITHDRAFT_101877 [Guillardia theta CCMP2712]|eukprot:XP_005839706.1 hypothetical protein GUITHDRAFT_101877 [Guillardia theta CCMP2712]
MQAWGRLVSLNGRWSDVELSRNKMKFGRNSACQVKYDDMRISNLHFSIEKSSETDEKAVVWDYSTNGLFVNGNLIGRGNKQMIVDGDMLSLIVVPVRRSDGTYHHSDSSLNFIAYKFHFVSDEDETVDIAEVEEQPVAKVRYRGVRCDEEEELVKEGGEKKTMNHEGMKQNSQSLNEEVPALASNNIVHTQPNEQTSSSNNHFHSGMKEEKRMETTSSSSRTEQQVAVKVENQTKDEVEDENPPSAKRQCISPSDASNPRKSLDWSQNEENAGSLQEFEARYEKTNEIGEGAYAKVYVAVRKDTEQKVAVKILHLAKLKINGIRDSQVQDEINIQMKLSHPNIVRMLEYYFDAATKRFLLVMEHVAGGDLFEYLISKPDECISEELARKWFKQLLDGVEYCHSMEVSRSVEVGEK